MMYLPFYDKFILYRNKYRLIKGILPFLYISVIAIHITYGWIDRLFWLYPICKEARKSCDPNMRGTAIDQRS